MGKLERIQLCLSWAFAKSKGKREVGDMHGEERAMENDLDDDEETDQGGEEVELGAAEQALEQVGRGMQAVIRAQMIRWVCSNADVRRFPLVFDGAFADVSRRAQPYPSTKAVLPSLLLSFQLRAGSSHSLRNTARRFWGRPALPLTG